MGGWLKDAEAQTKIGFLGVPAMGGPFDPDQKESVEIADETLLPRIKPRDVSPHDLASLGWAYELSLQTKASLFCFAEEAR